MNKRTRPTSSVRPEDLLGLRCAQYVRDSTAHQRDGFGPEMQRNANRRCMEKYGLIDTGLEFVEFVSAFQGDQNELDRAIHAMKSGRFWVLLVAWPHRLTRSLERAAQIERAVREAGGWIVYSDTGRVAGADWVSDTITNFTNEMFSRNLSVLVTSGLEEKFASGAANGHPPLGCKHVYRRRDGTFSTGPEVHTIALRVVDSDQLPTLRALLERYASLGSYRATALYLNSLGHRTRRGNPFTASSVQEIIHNPFYGPSEIIRYHPGEEDERAEPTPKERQIFPEDIHDLWVRARERLVKGPFRVSSQRRVYPLHSILTCETCKGRRFHGQWSRHGYRMTRHADRTSKCPQANVKADEIESQVAEFLTAIQIPRSWRHQIAKLRQVPHGGDHGRDRLEGALKRLKQQYLWGDLDDSEYLKQRDLIHGELSLIPNPIQEIESYREPADQLRTIGAKLKRLLATGKPEALSLFQEFCDTAFTEIIISGSRVVEVKPKGRYREMMAIGLQERVCYGAVKRTRTSTPVMGTAS
jgi:DNA invertase Pin-like site-specific DNA recombinase